MLIGTSSIKKQTKTPDASPVYQPLLYYTLIAFTPSSSWFFSIPDFAYLQGMHPPVPVRPTYDGSMVACGYQCQIEFGSAQSAQ